MKNRRLLSVFRLAERSLAVALCLPILLGLSSPAHAELLDQGIVTTDTVSGLDWLDLTETAGMTMNEAIAANEEWRFATNSEVENLFEQMFAGYYDTHSFGYSSSEQNGYDDQTEDVETFLELFGINLGFPIYFTYGLYADEDEVIRLMGVSNRIGGENIVAGLGHTSNFAGYVESLTNQQIGTYLVRTSVVRLPPSDIAAVADISSDGMGDVALLALGQRAPEPPVVSVLSGAAAEPLAGIRFFNDGWHAIRMDAGVDADGNAVADDPFVAVLAGHRSSGVKAVQVRAARDGSRLGPNLRFFNANYRAIDVAVLDDTNGDGVSDDPSVAVLAENLSSDRQVVILKLLRTGELLGEWDISRDDQELVAAVGIAIAGGESRIGILTVDTSTGKSAVRSIRVADGAVLPPQGSLGAEFKVKDLAVQPDGDGDGQADDPAYVVLAETPRGASVARTRDVRTGRKMADTGMLGRKWGVARLAISPDVSGDGAQDMLALAVRKGSSRVRIKVRDAGSGHHIGNLSPGR